MNITLRKANALQNSINDAIKTIQLADTVSINEFQDAEAVIAVKAAELAQNSDRKIALTNALFSIRSAVADANSRVGINQRLTEVARIDKVSAINQQLAGFTVRTEGAVLAGKLEKIRNRKEDHRSIYGREDEVTTGVLDNAYVANYKAQVGQLKKAKQKLQDEVLELNVRTEIVLNEQTVAVLTREGLL